MLLALVAAVSLVYPSELDAAKAGLKAAAECSQNKYECGGVIYKTESGYTLSPIVTSQKKYGLPALEQFYLPGKPLPVADFHTHVDLSGNHLYSTFFSNADVGTNDGLHTTGYMYSFKDNMIRAYVPGYDDRDDEEVDLHNTKTGKKRSFFLTCGHIVGII